MRQEQAEMLAESLKASRWVREVVVRPNPEAEGGFALSVRPRDDARGTQSLVWSIAHAKFRELFRGERLPTRNRDLSIEGADRPDLRSLW